MKLTTYPSYKPSGIDWLPKMPAHWKPVRLRFATLVNPSKQEIDGVTEDQHVAFLPMEAVGEQGELDLSRSRALHEVFFNGYSYFRNGDVVVAKITPCFENGKGALLKGMVPGFGFGTTELTVLRPKPWLDGRFLYYVTASQPIRTLGEGSMYGAGGQKRVPEDFWRNLLIPLPEIHEQRTIAAFLDHETARIDRLIEKQQRLIKLLEEKRQAVISHAVTNGLDPDAPMKDSGVQWIGVMPQDWQVKRLKHCVTIHGGSTPSKERDDYWQGDIPWVSPKDMKCERIADSEDHLSMGAVKETGLRMVDPGTVLIVVRGMILAHSIPVAITACSVTINQDMKALVPRRGIAADYLMLLLRGIRDILFECVDSSAHGTKKVEWEDFGNLEIPVPPDNDQSRMVSETADAENRLRRLIEKADRIIALLKEHRAALISAAVTGQIDVRDWQPTVEEPEPPLLQAAEEPATYG